MVRRAVGRDRPAQGRQSRDEPLIRRTRQGVRLAAQIGGGIGGIVVPSVAIGLTAPHWPDRWLARDAGPLRLRRFDTRERYERLGVRWWKRRFPEGGAWAGGESKSTLPDLSDPRAVDRYVMETRRAEWVHWLSCLTLVPVLPRVPWYVGAGLAVITVTVNGVAIGIVRYNRVRLTEG